MTRTQLRAVRRAIALLELDRRRFAWSLVAGVLGLGSAVGLAACAAWLIARAAEMPPVLELTVAAVAVRTFGVSRALMRYLERLASHDLALRGMGRLREVIYDRLAGGDVAVLARLRRGDLLARTGEDVDDIGEVIVRAVLPMLVTFVVGVGTVVLVAWLHLGIGLALAATLLLAGVLGPWLALRGAALDEQAVVEGRARLTEIAVDVVDHGAQLRVSGLLPRIRRRLAEVETTLAKARDGAARPTALAAAVDNLALGLALLSAIVIGAPALGAGTLSGVELAVVVLTPLAAFEGTSQLGPAAVQWARSAAAAERVMALLDAADAPAVQPGSTGGDRRSAQLSARELAVGWPGHPVVATGIELDLHPGRSIAMVGASGVGKTTLLATLAGLIPPRGGRLELDGDPLGDLPRPQLSAHVALTGEDAHVFATTVLENLRVARGDISEEEAVRLLRRAGLREWLASLPHGVHTELGADATTISGGQRRRLLFARALASPAPLLLIDEPGEHLDAASADALITDLLSAARAEGRGVIIATHRLAPLAAADEVMLLTATATGIARVAARGPHAELLHNSEYRWALEHEAALTGSQEGHHGARSLVHHPL